MSRKLRLPGALVNGRYQGLAVGCFGESAAAGPRKNARLVLEADGKVSVQVGVIANAVASALGSLNIQSRELPLSPARIWQLIEASRQLQNHQARNPCRSAPRAR